MLEVDGFLLAALGSMSGGNSQVASEGFRSGALGGSGLPRFETAIAAGQEEEKMASKFGELGSIAICSSSHVAHRPRAITKSRWVKPKRWQNASANKAS